MGRHKLSRRQSPEILKVVPSNPRTPFESCSKPRPSSLSRHLLNSSLSVVPTLDFRPETLDFPSPLRPVVRSPAIPFKLFPRPPASGQLSAVRGPWSVVQWSGCWMLDVRCSILGSVLRPLTSDFRPFVPSSCCPFSAFPSSRFVASLCDFSSWAARMHSLQSRKCPFRGTPACARHSSASFRCPPGKENTPRHPRNHLCPQRPTKRPTPTAAADRKSVV